MNLFFSKLFFLSALDFFLFAWEQDFFEICLSISDYMNIVGEHTSVFNSILIFLIDYIFCFKVISDNL